LKANVSLSQFSWKAVPQLRTCSCKTPVSIVAVGSSHNRLASLPVLGPGFVRHLSNDFETNLKLAI